MRALPLILLALGACATAPAGPPPPPPELSFRDVKGVALVHRVAWRGPAPGPGETRRRDPLDALQSALAGRGLRTVTIELAERPAGELEALDQLARLAEWSAQDVRPDAGGPAVSSVGDKAAPVLQQLGVDALAVYVRAQGWGAPSPALPLYGQPLSMAPPPAPVAAIALVARDGAVITLAWGGGGEPFGGPGPLNAAEAVDAALALLVQSPAE
jgi:hypothetical protein